MNDTMRTAAADGEAPVNPYSLLEAVNSSSDTAHTGWLIFIGIMSYLLIAVAGVSHKDLLLASDIQLPIMQVRIGLTGFFLFAPIVVVMFHIGLVLQLVLLARKALEFDNAIRMLEVTEQRTHPLRLELHNFFFVQSLAGPERSRVMNLALHGLAWLSLVALPVVLLLYVQVVFLPYHDTGITWAHRVVLLIDVIMLVLIGTFLTRTESSIFLAFGRLVRAHPLTFASTAAVMLLVMSFSFLVATVPGEALDRYGRQMFASGGNPPFQADRTAYGFILPWLGQRQDGTLFGFFERNLNVSDHDLVVDKDVTAGEPTINLRGRDLTFARLDRTDLHQADLTGANLDGASLTGADLRGSLLQCADMNELILTENRREARCPTARRANFTRAKLKDARLGGIDLTGARFEEADLDGADLSYSNLAGVSFYGAHLERADLTGGVALYGANFGAASLQGADLTGAKLQGADFTSAGLQGAILAHAYLHAAVLRNADLEAADLYKAKLQGADFSGARIRAASFREAVVWQTRPPDRDQAELADFTDLAMGPTGRFELQDAKSLTSQIDSERLRGRIMDAFKQIASTDGRAGWPQTGDGPAWTALSAASQIGPADLYKARLTSHLLQFACKARWSNGSVATGLAKRAVGLEFRGDLTEVHDRLKADACPASKSISPKAFKALSTAVDVARSN